MNVPNVFERKTFVYKSPQQAEDNLTWWIHALRLQGWDVSLEFTSALGGIEREAEVGMNLNIPSAVIKVMSEQAFFERYKKETDQELAVVHELLHMVLADVQYATSKAHRGIAIERAIETLSSALLTLARTPRQVRWKKESSNGST